MSEPYQTTNHGLIADTQVKRLIAIARDHGWAMPDLRRYVMEAYRCTLDGIQRHQYVQIVTDISTKGGR